MYKYQTRNNMMEEWTWKQIGHDKFVYYKPESIMKKNSHDDLKTRALKIKKSVSFAKVAQIKNLKNHKIYLQPIHPLPPPNKFPFLRSISRSTLKPIKEQDSVRVLLKKPGFLSSTSSIMIKNSSVDLTARKAAPRMPYSIEGMSTIFARDYAFEKFTMPKLPKLPVIKYTNRFIRDRERERERERERQREINLKKRKPLPLPKNFGGIMAKLKLDPFTKSSNLHNTNKNNRIVGGQPAYRADTFASKKGKNLQAGQGISGFDKKSNRIQSSTPARSINKSKPVAEAEAIEKKGPSIIIKTGMHHFSNMVKKPTITTNNNPNLKQAQTRANGGNPSYRSDTAATKLAKDLLINPRKFKSPLPQSLRPNNFSLNKVVKKRKTILPEYFGGGYPDLPSKSSVFTYLRIGMRVSTNLHIGNIRYIGRVTYEPDVWVGLELDAPIGKHDGFYRGTRYFTVQKDYGVLVRVSQVNYNGVNGCWIVPTELQPYVMQFPEDRLAIYMLECLARSFTNFRKPNPTKIDDNDTENINKDSSTTQNISTKTGGTNSTNSTQKTSSADIDKLSSTSIIVIKAVSPKSKSKSKKM